MVKVCGVTFDHTTNYGSCLQAYALQNVIEGMEIGGEKCQYQLIPRRTFPTKRYKAKNPMVMAKLFVLKQLTAYRRKQFASFEDRYMHFANCHNRDELPKLNDLSDAFVCGSDVIWNFSYTKADPIFFLDFAKKYKFSYAASFGKADINYDFDGVKLPDSPEALYSKYLPTLNAISVREKTGLEIVKRFTNKEAALVCDPVILLDSDDWKRIIPPPKKRGRYIFAYNTSIKPNFSAFLKRLQQQTGLPVIHVTWTAKDAIKQRCMYCPSPDVWLSDLLNAEYVVTNSFHATAFATIFHKSFYTVMQDGKNSRTNVRLYDFIHEMGLDERIYSSVPANIDLASPKFDHADQRIAQWRDQSLQYLRENLSSALMEKKERES